MIIHYGPGSCSPPQYNTLKTHQFLLGTASLVVGLLLDAVDGRECWECSIHHMCVCEMDEGVIGQLSQRGGKKERRRRMRV